MPYLGLVKKYTSNQKTRTSTAGSELSGVPAALLFHHPDESADRIPGVTPLPAQDTVEPFRAVDGIRLWPGDRPDECHTAATHYPKLILSQIANESF